MSNSKVEPMHIVEAAPEDQKAPPDGVNAKEAEAEALDAVEFEALPPADDCWHRFCRRLQLLICPGGDSGGSGQCGRPVGLAKRTCLAALALGYTIYLAYCTFLLATKYLGTPDAEQSVRLLWVSAAAAAAAAARWAPRRCCRPAVGRIADLWRQLRGSERLRSLAAFWWLAESAVIAAFLAWVAVDRPSNLVSAAGALLLLLLALAISPHPDRVNWKPVLGGIVIQLVFAALILRTTWGFEFFNFLGDRTAEFVGHCQQGSKFMFGDNYQEHYFAFGLLPVVVYFSSVLTVLFHLGVLQAVICRVGSVMQMVMGTTAAESMVASANIFVGQTEAPLMIRPFLKQMTNSEIHSVMTSGFATIAGGALAAYIAMGVPARHLLSASVMSGPAALAVSKLAYPETQRSRTRVADVRMLQTTRYGSVIEAAGMGAMASLPVVGAIAVNLIAFISILTFINASLTWLGYRAGVEFPLTLEYIMSFVFWPLALAMGVSPRDCRQVAELIGIKTFLNEFVAYQRLTTIKQNYRTYTAARGNWTHLDYSWFGTDVVIPSLNLTLPGGVLFEDRSMVIATYALCGFSNLGSIGILIGALTAMAPTRQADIAACAPRAMVAGSIACFITASIAGLFFTDGDLVLNF